MQFGGLRVATYRLNSPISGKEGRSRLPCVLKVNGSMWVVLQGPFHKGAYYFGDLPQTNSNLDNHPNASIRQFPNIRGTLLWGPYNKDPTM